VDICGSAAPELFFRAGALPRPKSPLFRWANKEGFVLYVYGVWAPAGLGHRPVNSWHTPRVGSLTARGIAEGVSGTRGIALALAMPSNKVSYAGKEDG
jgi:hypothetical protein